MECKVSYTNRVVKYCIWFNRDIVECKDDFLCLFWPHPLRFNRDIVECKGFIQLWILHTLNWFNRDIVECKVFLLIRFNSIYCDLIETLWNVKNVQSRTTSSAQPDLIETLWNVKCLTPHALRRCSRFNRDIVECKVQQLRCNFPYFQI